jgi:arsenite transporter
MTITQVRWDKLPEVFGNKALLVLTLTLNWVIGPFLMYFLAVIFFRQYNLHFMAGLSLVGCARCIAMVSGSHATAFLSHSVVRQSWMRSG